MIPYEQWCQLTSDQALGKQLVATNKVDFFCRVRSNFRFELVGGINLMRQLDEFLVSCWNKEHTGFMQQMSDR